MYLNLILMLSHIMVVVLTPLSLKHCAWYPVEEVIDI